MKITVDAENDGIRLARYLRSVLLLSTHYVSSLKFREDGISVNGQPCNTGVQLHAGDTVEFDDGDSGYGNRIIPSDIPIDIIYEDDDIVAVSKPPEMPTHTSAGHPDDTLANALAFRYGAENFVFRPVNRLDRNTSGLVLIAKNRRAASVMFTIMKSGRIKKTYFAVCDGAITADGCVSLPIRRKKDSIIEREVCSDNDVGAQNALTEYRVISANSSNTLLAVMPETGRTHQIRVHMAAVGHAVTGDTLYGTESAIIKRQALHAYSLTFDHPFENRTLTLTAPLPDDILKAARTVLPTVNPILTERKGAIG